MKLFSRMSHLVVWFIVLSLPGYAQKASQAPTPQTLTVNPDNLRALQNSVNLFSGQVSFPMELASLPGRGGLNMSVAIQYNSSGISKTVDVNNMYSPTGVLGLGWSLDIPRIIADTKQTGTRQDDTYYYIENGVSNALICKSYSPTIAQFETRNFSAWKVEHDPTQEKWIIVRDNGFKYTYTAVQWMVKWGNWIGNSAQTQNQSRMAYVWAISEVENLWGDKLTFEYNLIDEAVGSGGLSHTKAFYLAKIKDPVGQTIELHYETKAPDEYQDPHQERAEPDAYQEKYETLYLSSLTVKTPRSAVMYSVVLGFETLTWDLIAKRCLKTIQKQFPSGEHQPAIEFEYFKSGVFSGCLKTVFNSLGAHIEYTYGNVDVIQSGYSTTISPPTGYGQLKTYVVGNYCVVTWRKLKTDGAVDSNPQSVKVQAYYWDGGWKATDLWEIPGISNPDYELADIAVQSSHFVYRLYSIQSNTFRIYAAHLKARAASGGIWEKKEMIYTKEGRSLPNEIGRVYAGEDFICFNIRWLQTIDVLTWRDEQWIAETIQIDDNEFENFLTAGVNFIFLHNDAKGSRDQLHLYYLNAEKEWTESKVPDALSFTTEGSEARDSHWHACNSFVFGLPQYNPEYVFMWDENYGNFVKVNVVGQYDDASLISLVADGMVGLTQSNHNDGVALRYDGNNWYKQTYGYRTYKETSYAPDLALRSENTVFDQGHRAYVFNPNTLSWEDQNYGVLPQDHLNDQYGNAIQAGIDVILGNERLFRRGVSGGWEYGDRIAMEASEYLIGNTAVVMAPNYVAYEYSTTKSGKAAGTYVLHLKNNRVANIEKITGYGLDPAKSNAGLSVLALRSIGAGASLLYRVTDQRMAVIAKPAVVIHTTWTDGSHVFKTKYDYANGVINAIEVPQFNVVITGLGDDGISKGFTRYYFYNGLPSNVLQEQPSANYAANENLLTGRPYCIATHNSIGTEVSRMTQNDTVVYVPIKNSNQRIVGLSHVVRTTRETQRMDNVFTSAKNTYDQTTWQLRATRQSNSGAAGTGEQVTASSMYWWEAYDPNRTRNILSPVVQMKSIAMRTGSVGGGTYTSTTATKWSYDGARDKYFPGSSYAWNHSGSPDFIAWGDAATPSGDWRLVSKVSKLDPADGTVLETEQKDGSRTAFLFDATHSRILAKTIFSTFDQVAYSSFEDNATGNWSYNTTFATETAAFAGAKGFFAAGNVDARLTSKTLSEDTYEVSFWSKGLTGAVEVQNGSILETASEEVQNEWTLVRALVQINGGGGIVRIKVPANSWIDEARLRPRGAEMTTYVYDDTGNVLVETDTNLYQRRLEYDTQYRLKAVKDHQGRIVKKYVYHYRNQP